LNKKSGKINGTLQRNFFQNRVYRKLNTEKELSQSCL